MIDGWAIHWLGNRFAAVARSFQPGFFCHLHFAQGFFWCFAKCGTEAQIWNVGNIAAIFFGVKDADKVVLQVSPQVSIRPPVVAVQRKYTRY